MNFKIKIIRFGLLNLIEYMLVVFIILECRSVYSVSLDYHIPIDLIVILLTFLLVLYGLVTGMIRIKKNSAAVAFMLIAYLIVFFLFNVIWTSNRMDFIYKFFLFLPIITILENAEEGTSLAFDLLKKYAFVMVLLSAFSLFFWLFGSLLKIVPATGTIHYYWAIKRISNSYFGVYFENAKDTFLFLNLYRNSGIFTEAPMYSLNITLALAINIFISDSKAKFLSKKNIVLILATISCVSLTGVGFIVVAVLAKNFFENKKGTTKKIIIVLVIVVVGIMGQNIIDIKMSTNSYLVRIDDYIVGFQAWMDNFFFGGGYGIRNYQGYLKSWRSFNTGYSNSLFWILAQGGIYLFFIYLFPALLSLKRYIKNQERGKIILLLLVWYLIITTSFGYQFVLLLLVSLWYQDAIISLRR